jgi:hypothetical protein
MSEQWLSIIEYARRFKISDMTIRRRIKTGKLQAVLQDGKYYIPLQGQELELNKEEESDKNARDFPNSPNVSQPDRARTHQSSAMTLIKGHPQPHYYSGNFSQQPDLTREDSNLLNGVRQTTDKNTALDTARAHSMPSRVGAPNIGGPGVKTIEYSNIPENLWKPLANAPFSVVDTKALLAYCEATVKKSYELERKAVDRFKSKIESLEAHLQAKDLEIKALRQQIEDMQLLVKVIERRK